VTNKNPEVFDMNFRISLLLTVLFLSTAAHAQNTGIPHLEKRGTATQLVVDGKPFLILGGELLNSSSSSLDYMRPVWPQLAAIPVNTVLTPLSWELIEPKEGHFDFTLVDGLIQGARQSNLHIVFLWLASWKNGMSSYAPIWVKQDTRRFPRVIEKSGVTVEILSPLSKESAEADARAYAAVMRHIREVDGEAHTVLMMQVENEVGVLGDSRDRSAVADQAFAGQIPAELTSYLQQNRETLIPEFRKRWESAGGKTSGTWEEAFGRSEETDKIFMAWNYGRYIQSVAAAGKAEYPIPMYVNTWLAGPHASPGQYPSGGPLPEVMDLWKAAGSAIDIYAPDIYAPNFEEWCARFNRAGNPLLIPEARHGAAGAAQVFYAIGAHDGMGFSPFGIDSFVDKERPTELDPDDDLGKSYEVLASVAPLIFQHQGKHETAGFLLDADHPQATAELQGYQLEAHLDRFYEANTKEGFGLIIAVGPNEFVGAGMGLSISFHLKAAGPHVGISYIDEGTYSGGAWIPGKRLNGDEDEQGRDWRFIAPRIRIEKAVLYQYP
jgi:hypothetical protein